MSSPVHWAALGLVIERPAYGAELCRRYEAEYAALLPVTGASHIYTALNELERRGYIEEFPGKCGTASSSRLPLPYYRATDVGIEAYGRRLEEQVAFELRKQGIWVRQLSIFADDPETALGLLARLRSRFLDGLGGGHAGRGKARQRTAHAELIAGLVSRQELIAKSGMLSWLGYAGAALRERAARAR